MSIDRSLRLRDALVRHRNVLTRAERIDRLKDEERWEEGKSVLGLPKVVHRKSHAGKKAAKEKAAVEGETVGVEGAAAEPAAPGAAPTAGAAKAAAPATQKPGKETKKK
jgi:small basic protein (TIGR04137 family)